MAHPTADIFRSAAAFNRNDSRRKGNVVSLGGEGEVVVAGDIHGHRRNLARILSHADLPAHPTRTLVVQEVIHTRLAAEGEPDRSIECLMRLARLKARHPQQLLMVLGNHDVAEIAGSDIMKSGRSYAGAFREGVAGAFGEEHADEILQAVRDLLLSVPLAVRCGNGVWVSHTLPAPTRMEMAGFDILERAYEKEDLHRGAPLYEWTWGRGLTEEHLDALADRLEVSLFVLGHQHVEEGIRSLGPRGVTLASDHEGGKILGIDLGKPLTSDAAVAAARPIADL